MQIHNSAPKDFQNHSKVNNSFTHATNEFATDTSKVLNELQKDKCPLDVLPGQFKNLITELADKYKFPVDFSLMYLIYAFSIAIGNNYRIRVKRNWIEPAVLYMAVVALAGQTKTPVQSFFMAIFKEWDKTNFERFSELLAAYEVSKNAATKNNPCIEEKPKRQQSLLQDYTPEALIKVLSDNWHGVGVMMDELAGFFGNMNRYNNGNEVPMWLAFYNVQAYSSNRKTSPDAYVAHPFVSIIGGIQPGILVKTFAGDMQINGAIDRFLFVFPTGVKKEVPTDKEIDISLVDAYTDAVNVLLRIEPKTNDQGRNIPRLLDFTPSAKKLLFEYLQVNADKVNELNEAGSERMAGMYSKFDYHVIRLSFILQVIDDACNGSEPADVTEDAVKGGIRLADYFKLHAERIHGLISGDPLAAYTDHKKAFYRQLPDGEFAFADAIVIASEIRKGEVDAGKIKADAVEKWAQRFLSTTDLFSQPKTGYYIKKSIIKT